MDTKNELFKKVYIKTEADLPKADGEFWAKYDSTNDVCLLERFIVGEKKDRQEWLKRIDWYFQPIELKEIMPTDEEIKKWAKLTNQTNFSYTFCDGLIWSEKWFKSEIEKRNT